GIGLTFFGGALTGALRAAVDGLARLVVGDDPTQTEAIAAKLRRAAGSSGPGGIFTLALSAIDIACWDLKGKALGRSVCALVGGRIEPYHLFWLEDPTTHDDYPGLARIAAALTTPIAAGEYHYGIAPFRHLLEARSIDIPMIDLLRVGGITQWMKVAGMAEAFNLPVVSHLVPEIHVHLVAAAPNGLTVEYMPWTLRLFEETPKLERRQLVVPQKPGLGLACDAAAIK